MSNIRNSWHLIKTPKLWKKIILHVAVSRIRPYWVIYLCVFFGFLQLFVEFSLLFILRKISELSFKQVSFL